MRLPNPNADKPYDKITKDEHGNPRYGYRNPNTPDEEIVDLQSGKSNHTYYQPEVVLNPEGCPHVFHIIDIGKREIECGNCQFSTSFVPGVNEEYRDGNHYVKIKGHEYQLTSL